MIFFRAVLILFFLNSYALSNENIPVKYIDVNFIINNSIVGKKIKEKIINERKKLDKKHKNTEDKLKNKKNDILAKKDILKEEDFKKEADKHQKNVELYKVNRKNDIEKMNKKNLELSKNFMVKIDKIIIDYSRENSIDLLLKRDALIVSNSKLDITKQILEEVDKKIKKIE